MCPWPTRAAQCGRSGLPHAVDRRAFDLALFTRLRKSPNSTAGNPNRKGPENFTFHHIARIQDWAAELSPKAGNTLTT